MEPWRWQDRFEIEWILLDDPSPKTCSDVRTNQLEMREVAPDVMSRASTLKKRKAVSAMTPSSEAIVSFSGIARLPQMMATENVPPLELGRNSRS